MILISDIVRAVARNHHLTPEQIYSPSRQAVLLWPRWTAQWLAWRLTGQSVSQVARRFNRDHTTLLPALQKVRHRLETDLEFRRVVDKLENSLIAAETGRQWVAEDGADTRL